MTALRESTVTQTDLMTIQRYLMSYQGGLMAKQGDFMVNQRDLMTNHGDIKDTHQQKLSVNLTGKNNEYLTINVLSDMEM